KEGRAFVSIVLMISMIELLFSYTSSTQYLSLVFRIAIILGSISAAYIIIKNIEKLGIENNRDLLGVANAWTKLILAHDGSALEDVFNSIGREVKVRIRALVFNRNNDKIALIVPGVHFGPFRTLGSSSLPYQIDEVLVKKGVKTFVFHGAGSHELNITCSAEAQSFAKAVGMYVLSKMKCGIELRKPFRVFNGVREALVIPTSSNAMIAISSPIIGGDDLPAEVQKLADEIGRVYGYSNVMVVDCHNLEGRRELNSEVFIPLIKAALSRDVGSCRNVKVGYGEAHTLGYVRGMCSNKVKVLVLQCDEAKYAFIYLYGNNASIGVRETIRRLILDKGLAEAEVFTADDHTCSGTTFDAPYYAIDLNSALLRTIDSALHKALEDLKTAAVCIVDEELKVKVVGESIYELFELAKNAGDIVVKGVKRTLLILYSLSMLLAVLRGIHLI
ncbi:MAG TPA: DUF2070 family protein, partial [Ignisphaera sp.]|nr:DUF2070 family protein [Ignisphaera sp.]